MTVGLVLLVLAFIFAVFAALRLLPHPRIHWGWLAVAFWLASQLVGSARLL